MCSSAVLIFCFVLFYSPESEVSAACTLCACVTAHGSIFFCLLNWKCDGAASSLLRHDNIKLIADCHGDFAHPSQSLDNNNGSVSAPHLAASDRGAETARCSRQRCSMFEMKAHSVRQVIL